MSNIFDIPGLVPRRNRRSVAASGEMASILASFFARDLAQIAREAKTRTIGSKSIRLKGGRLWVKDFFSGATEEASPKDVETTFGDILEQLKPFYKRTVSFCVTLDDADFAAFASAAKRLNLDFLRVFEGTVVGEQTHPHETKYYFQTNLRDTTVIKFYVERCPSLKISLTYLAVSPSS